MADWGFLTNHARVLLHIAHDPGARLRDIAASLGITERRAHGIITDLAEAGYVITQKDGRRNRYQIQAHLPVPEQPGTRERPSARSSPCSQPGAGPEPDPPRSVTVMSAAPARRKLPSWASCPTPDFAGQETPPDRVILTEHFRKFIASFLGPA